MTSITVNVPTHVATPRGAAFAGAVYSALASGFALWRAARAERRVVSTRSAEAAAVRAYAYQLMSQDRRLAADLLRAADRHERF